MKADPPLIINANAVLTGTTAFERLKVIAQWNSQILKAISDFELPEFSSGDPGNIDKFFYPMAMKLRNWVLKLVVI
jgi:hypothetical protein